jgi:predicted ABC-type sugar transport system permease subunit
MMALLGRDVEIYVTLAMKLTFIILTGGVKIQMTILPPHAHVL